MTDNEIRIVIAEKCGWEKVHIGSTIGVCGYEPNTPKLNWTCVPDYPNDLNTMHEAEKTITGNRFVEYIRTLKYVCNPGCNLTNEHNQFSHVTATARQRAEAFIKTVCPEKWKGNE